MNTRNWVLLGLGVAVAGAVAALLTTEQGKKLRNDAADRLTDWRDELTKMAKRDGDGLAMAAKHTKANAARHLKHLP